MVYNNDEDLFGWLIKGCLFVVAVAIGGKIAYCYFNPSQRCWQELNSGVSEITRFSKPFCQLQ